MHRPETGVDVDGVERHPLVVAADADDHWGDCSLDGVTAAAPPEAEGTAAPGQEAVLRG